MPYNRLEPCPHCGSHEISWQEHNKLLCEGCDSIILLKDTLIIFMGDMKITQIVLKARAKKN